MLTHPPRIKKATCVPKVVEENGLIAFVEHVLLPASSLLDGERHFTVEQRDAEPLIYRDIEAVKKDYVADVVSAFFFSKKEPILLTMCCL